jgi:hypothetical protein
MPASIRLLTATAVLALAAGACQSPPGPRTAAPACNDTALQWAVGQPGDEATMRRLAAEAGPVLINPVGPASVLARDTRSDRLRVFLDAANTITAVRCG